MIPSQTFDNYPVFGNNATKVQPDNSKYSNGFLEGDVYPAEWVNWAWAKNSKGVADLNTGLTSVEKELNTILTCAGFTSCADCTDQVYKSIMCRIEACVGTSAPKAHASSATTYGVGTADCYGHLKISDTYTSVLSACAGVAASQKAVACVYDLANGKAAVGNTAGCALGSAAAGVATTAARSDHVHPLPTVVECSCFSNQLHGNLNDYRCGLQLAVSETSINMYQKQGDTTKNINLNVSGGICQVSLYNGTADSLGTLRLGELTSLGYVTASSGFRSGINNGYFYTSDGNTLNYSSNYAHMWLNYRGGTCIVNIGDGTGNGCLGILCAKGFCGLATCASNNGSGVAFGTAATCAATAFRASDWWPNSIECGCVQYAGFACSIRAYSWNGRSDMNGNCACACFTTSANGTLTFCNKSCFMMFWSARNSSQQCAGIIPPGGTASITCMSNGTSCAAYFVAI